MIIGQICLDTNTDYDGTVDKRYGGAVLFSGHAAAAAGNKVAIVPKGNPATVNAKEAFADCPDVVIFDRYSKESTLMDNTYFTADRERRNCVCSAMIDPYTVSDIPDEETKLYHISGLVFGDVENDVLKECAKRAPLALDIQTALRRREPDHTLKLYDWDLKKEYLPLVTFLKTDAAEAEILTGTDDREKAAKMLYDWGAKEICITHNTEVIAYDGNKIYKEPLKPLGLSGRTGRGDTTFAAYTTERLKKGIEESLLFAAGFVSLKMNTPGPFMGTRQDVEDFIKKYY